MSTQIDIVIYSIDKENIYILSSDDQNHTLPNIPICEQNIDISNLNIEYYIYNLISKYTNIDPKWANPKLIDIEIYNNNNILSTHIYYSCYVPNVSKKSGYWIAMDKNTINNKIIKKILCLR
jgi:hypothetical protein